MSNYAIFKNPVVNVPVVFPGGSTNSANTSLVGLLGIGNAQMRRLSFPANWITSDISIFVYDDNTFTNPNQLYICDGVTNAAIMIVGAQPNSTISLPAPWLDSVDYFYLVSSSVQPALQVSCLAAPIYQVPS